MKSDVLTDLTYIHQGLMHHRENIKQRVSESRAKRVWTLPRRCQKSDMQIPIYRTAII